MKEGFENTNDNSNLDNMRLKQHPLGVKPQYVWILERTMDIQEAITRYAHAGLEIPPEWITEYNGLTNLTKELNIRRANK